MLNADSTSSTFTRPSFIRLPTRGEVTRILELWSDQPKASERSPAKPFKYVSLQSANPYPLGQSLEENPNSAKFVLVYHPYPGSSIRDQRWYPCYFECLKLSRPFAV
eukprot:gene5742-15807_t